MNYYLSVDSVDKAPKTKEKLEKSNSKIPSGGKKPKTKGFGFKVSVVCATCRVREDEPYSR